MAESTHTVEVHVPALGSDCERILTSVEATALRRLLCPNQSNPEGHDCLLAGFASFMAGEVLKDRDISSTKQTAFLAAHCALDMRRHAMLEEWPEDVSPPGFIYDFFEKWLDETDDETYGRRTMAGLSIREYLTQEQE